MGGEDGLGVTTGQPNLYKQDLSKLDPSKLTALSREAISRQATINIGTIGHVAHGKSTIVKAISGVQTVRFKNELERNITIKLDAADGCSGELADISGGVDSRTPAVCKKRCFSPAGGIDTAPCTKRPRLLDTKSHYNVNMPHRLDTKTLHSSSVWKPRQNKRIQKKQFTQQIFKTFHGGGSSGSGSSVSSICSSSSSISSSSSSGSSSSSNRSSNRITGGGSGSDGCRNRKKSNTRDTGSDGRQSDYEESSSDGRSSTRTYSSRRSENATMLELKEVRVLLQDVMRNGKYREEAVAAGEQFANRQKKLWEVERIIQKHEQNKEPLYLIKWKNWDSRYNTWEPLCNLVNCEDLLREFEEERQKLIDLFKAKANFYPQTRDVERFLADLRCKGGPIDVASITVSTAEVDEMYREIRRYLKNASHGKREVKIKRQLLCMLSTEMRRDQLESLQDWENEMTSITKGRPTIRVENLVDLEGAPQDFYYIDNYLPGTGVIIPDDPPIGCECLNVCETDKSGSCCYAQNGATSLPYTSARRVRVPPGTPIYECNKRCTCDVLTCPNRVVQRGSDTHLCIFRTDNGRGWGVRTLRAIKKGTFVAQYVGEVIGSEEAEKRGKQYDMTGRTYLFDLDYNETDGQCPYTVDAAMYGNVTHFINHSCDPNLAVYAIWINCLDPNLPNLALFAIKDIKQNEELTFDYTCQRPRGNDKMQQQPLETNADHDADVEVDFDGDTGNKTLCKCGAATCRRYLF